MDDKKPSLNATQKDDLDHIYDSLAGDLVTKLPESLIQGQEGQLLEELLDNIVQRSEGYNNFSHGIFFRYEVGEEVKILALSKRAEKAYSILNRPRLMDRKNEEVTSNKNVNEGILDWMRERKKPLIVRLIASETTIYEYATRSRIFRKISDKVDFSIWIKKLLLKNRDKKIFEDYGEPDATVTSAFSLWAPFIFPVQSSSSDTISQAPEIDSQNNRSVNLFMSLSFSKDPIENEDQATLALESLEEINRILGMIKTVSSMFALREYNNQLKEELQGLIEREMLTHGLLTAATLFIGVRHMLVGSAQLLEEELASIFKQYKSEKIKKKDKSLYLEMRISNSLDIAHKIAGITQGLRDFSLNIPRLESEVVDFDSLRTLLDEVIFLLQISPSPEHDIITEVIVSDDFPKRVVLPKGAVQLILFILLQNAKASMDYGKICISLGTSGKDVLFEIKDQGTGIPKNVQKNLFKPFFTTKDPSKHTGLGLYMVKRVVDRLNGSLEYDTELGKGTIFRVIIPQ